MKVLAAAAVLAFGFVLLNFTACLGDLQVGFYKGKCGSQDVEGIIRGVVKAQFAKDRTIVPALLRMHFHDCFVMGCDASILIDGPSSEKTARPNLSVRGYDIIDQAKSAVEKVCPGIVSCADIIAIATRDAVTLGERSTWSYNVPTGRRDGLVSLASNVNLPSPSITVPQSIAAFAEKGLNPTDMVLLLGGHTVGVTHCSVIKDRLYNFQNTSKPDPTMSSLLVMMLRLRCPQSGTTDNTVNLDQGTLFNDIIDNSYYKQILNNRGVLKIDQELALDPLTNDTVSTLATDYSNFAKKFGAAMVKMGGVDVLTGNQGQIRKTCRMVNSV